MFVFLDPWRWSNSVRRKHLTLISTFNFHVFWTISVIQPKAHRVRKANRYIGTCCQHQSHSNIGEGKRNSPGFPQFSLCCLLLWVCLSSLCHLCILRIISSFLASMHDRLLGAMMATMIIGVTPDFPWMLSCHTPWNHFSCIFGGVPFYAYVNNLCSSCN